MEGSGSSTEAIGVAAAAALVVESCTDGWIDHLTS